MREAQQKWEGVTRQLTQLEIAIAWEAGLTAVSIAFPILGAIVLANKIRKYAKEPRDVQNLVSLLYEYAPLLEEQEARKRDWDWQKDFRDQHQRKLDAAV